MSAQKSNDYFTCYLNFFQVCVFFNKKLYRGNRATKMASGDFEAFGTPNLPPLATVGSDITGEWVW